MTAPLRLAIASCFMLSMGPAAAADLSDLLGSWSGRGTVSEGPGGQARRGACNLSVQGGEASVTLSGRCAGPGKAASFGGTISQHGSSSVSARFSSPGRPSVSYSGTQNGSSVTMRSTSSITVDGKTYRFQLQIQSHGSNSFSMTQNATEIGTGRRSQVLNMVFQKK
ncbi:MAG: hypothetical protein KDJ72_00150 [Methyloceanibacter sp.]|uniref:hypothetical protein n=1 Tax=Methyloceanibacter sp. TaxID=1965321 RepID=UPI001D903735|nr:hypothetical protein [Methyloceanibacter sp.]MCB1441407.1 hypothetical protein [Methyloceanibacter sp.]